jgi:putative ABC transport system permease protein
MRIILIIALQNLLQAKRRSALLGTAVALVTALLVLLNALSLGVSNNLVSAATTLSAGHVNVAGFHKTSASDSSPIVTKATELRALLAERTPDVDYVLQRHRGWAKVVSDRASIQSGLSGVIASEESVLFEKLQLAKESEYVEGGRDEVIGDPQKLAERNSCLLFATQAKRLEVQVGDKLTVRSENPGGMANTLDLTVVAVMRDVGMLSSWTVFVNNDDILDLYQLNADTTGGLYVYLKDIDRSEEVMGELRGILATEGYELMDYRPEPFFFKFEQVAGEDWTGQKLDLTTWRDEVSFLTWILTALDTLSFSLIAILLAIIAIGIANTMIIAVRERTREIGTVRAIGMGRSQVLQLFLYEALILGLVATTLGAFAGAVLAIGIDAMELSVPIEAMQTILLSDVVHMEVDPARTAVSVIVLTVFTGLSALWPAFRAAKLQPVDALHQIE